jgi:hypothetical protein
MSDQKKYGVLLNDLAVREIGKLLARYSRSNEFGTYLLAKSVDPMGPFLQLVVEDPGVAGVVPPADIELQIPHSFVKAIVYSADIKKIGFAT